MSPTCEVSLHILPGEFDQDVELLLGVSRVADGFRAGTCRVSVIGRASVFRQVPPRQ